MIDTIVLMLDTHYKYKEEMFRPQTKQVGNNMFYKHIKNPTKDELNKYGYLPRITLMKRFGDTKLKIEFSAPKLIFGNNFDELTTNDFDKVIERLQQKLSFLDIKIFKSILENALVSSVHYSKNIILTDHTIPYTYLKQLSKVNVNKHLDTNKIVFRNDGHGITYHTNSFEIAFYDKIKDLQQGKISEKRAIEKDNAIQLNLFDALMKRNPLEVLRMEIRLNKRQKIRQVLKAVNNEVEPTFFNLFSQDLSKQVLLHYLKTLEEAYPPLLMYPQDTPTKIFTGLLVTNPKIKLLQALKMLGLKALLEENSVRGFRELTKRYKDSSWYSLNKEMKKLNVTDEVSIFSVLREALTSFEPIKSLTNQKLKS